MFVPKSPPRLNFAGTVEPELTEFIWGGLVTGLKKKPNHGNRTGNATFDRNRVGSGSELSAARLVRAPPEPVLTVATTCATALDPIASVPNLQVTTPFTCEQLEGAGDPAVAETYFTPAGNVSTML